jgi:hypothetical protein
MRAYDASMKFIGASVNLYGAPTDLYHAPWRRYESPTKLCDAPMSGYHAPTGGYQPPMPPCHAFTARYQPPISPHHAPISRYVITTNGHNAAMSFRGSSAQSHHGKTHNCGRGGQIRKSSRKAAVRLPFAASRKNSDRSSPLTGGSVNAPHTEERPTLVHASQMDPHSAPAPPKAHRGKPTRNQSANSPHTRWWEGSARGWHPVSANFRQNPASSPQLTGQSGSN